MTTVIRVLALAGGDGTPAELKLLAAEGIRPGEWLASYDVDGRDGLGSFTTTPNLDAALRFPDGPSALRAWTAESTVLPVRPDGRPNRPMTAFTVELEPVP